MGLYLDLKMRRLFWFICVGSKCRHKCPCKREAEGDWTQQRRRWHGHVGRERREVAIDEGMPAAARAEMASGGSMALISAW